MKSKPLANPTQNSLNHNLAIVRSDINTFLSDYYARQRIRAADIDSNFGFLWEAMSSQHQAGGKRFRPYLCVLAYEALGGNNYHQILPICASLELLHAALLTHDDIIDRDFIRHSQPNVPGIYSQHYSSLLKDVTEIEHFAHSAAILSGDILISEAYQLIINSTVAPEQRLLAAELLGEAVYSVTAGELLDTEAALYPPDYTDSLKIAELKTAVYSCSIPLAIGGMLAGADDATQQALRRIGSKLGIAYQLTDDLLGMFSEESVTGKSNISDLREGKRTYLLQLTLRSASPTQLKELNGFIGNANCTSGMAERARQIMIECGAKTEVEVLIKQYSNQAKHLVLTLPVNEAAQKRINDFINQAVRRTS